MIHHLSHEIHIGHEHRSVSLFEKVVESHETLLELVILGQTHMLSKLVHNFGSFGLLSSMFDGLEEKLQGRFLQYYGGVRGLRLS